MADKYEYWHELFGEEIPDYLRDNDSEREFTAEADEHAPEEKPTAEKSLPVDEFKANLRKKDTLGEIYAVPLYEPSEKSAKWAYFGGGEPDDDSAIWFDIPGVKTAPEKEEPGIKQPVRSEPEERTSIITGDIKEFSTSSATNSKARGPVEEPTRMDGRIDEFESDPDKKQKAAQRKGRNEKFIVRGRRNKFGCLGGIMYFVFVAGISILLAMLLWLGASDVLALNKSDTTAIITVEKNFEIKDVSKQLKDAGIIKYDFLFNLFAKFSHAKDKIDPGTYELSSQYDYRALIVKMQAGAGSQLTESVMIPEGYTVKQVFQLLDDKNVCDYDVLMSTAATYPFKHEFLKDIPIGDASRLEGYVFPDTYEFYIDDDPVGVINKMLNNFDKRVTAEMRDAAEELGVSLHDIIIIASLIEKEAANDKERPDIASVIYNRLNNWDVPLLQIDATIQYALPERKEKLTYSDLEIDSPYNTYKNPGLPVGPIANPGLASIKAAINPNATDYYYYALGQEKAHEFFKSYDSFQNFINSDKFGG